MYIGLQVKYLLFLFDYNQTWVFSRDVRKIRKYQISWKCVQWEPGCSIQKDRRTYGQTDMTKLIVALRNFRKAPKNYTFLSPSWSGFDGLGVSVLASGTQVRGFKPGRSRRIFKGEKILSTPSFGREIKQWVPCRRFAAWKSAFILRP
jgi:hypothetical protein